MKNKTISELMVIISFLALIIIIFIIVFKVEQNETKCTKCVAATSNLDSCYRITYLNNKK